MKKRMLLVIATVALMFYVPTVSAATIEVNDDATLVDAFKNAKNNDTIKLTDSITHDGTYLMVDNGRTLTLDLNGYNLTTLKDKDDKNRSVTVYDGKLTVTGKGTITREGHNALSVWGSSTPVTEDFSVLEVGKDVTLVGDYGVAILYGKTEKNSYGVKVTFAGKATGTASGITVSGYMKHENGPVVIIEDGAQLTGGTEAAIYVAGNSTWTIGNAIVDGNLPLGIKSGTVTINGGTYTATGEAKDPKECGNCINPTGSAILIESNSNYYGKVNLTINDGKFVSTNKYALEEYITSAGVFKVDNLAINGGTFIPKEGEPTFSLTSELTTKIPGIVSGGVFTGDISSVLKPGYKSYINSEGNVLISKVEVATGTFKVMGKATDVSEGAVVQLKQGSKVLQATVVDENGDYVFENVAKGVYTLVLNGNFESISKYVEVTKDTTVNINALAPGNKIVFVGENAPDIAVKGLDEISSEEDIVMIIGTDEESKEEQDAIKKEVKADNYDFIGIEIVNNDNEYLTETNNILMLALSYDLEGKTNIGISRYHDEEVSTFTKLDALPEDESDYKDGTYFIDEDNNMIYIFANKFSSFAVTYDNQTTNEVVNPKTGDSILNYVGIMFITVTILGTSVYFLRKKENN